MVAGCRKSSVYQRTSRKIVRGYKQTILLKRNMLYAQIDEKMLHISKRNVSENCSEMLLRQDSEKLGEFLGEWNRETETES